MMEKNTAWLSVFRRVVPADYELWLEDLARQGWNIDKIGQFDSLRMTFTRTEPRQYRYVFDLNAFAKQDYFNTYEQFGWEYVGQMASCFVWRRAYQGKRPEAFTDRASMAARNRRVRNAVLFSLVLFAIGLLGSVVGLIVFALRGNGERVLEFALQTGLLAAFTAYLAWVVRQIQRNLER